LGYIFATKAHIDNRKKMLSNNISCTCPPQYGEPRPTSGWDGSGSFGHPVQLISTGFASWQRYSTALQYWASAKLCGV